MVKLAGKNGSRIKFPKVNKHEPLKIDLGCGPNKREGFKGADSIKFPGVDYVVDLKQEWPWKDSSVEEAHCSHCLEHFDATERLHFMNELYRVLKPGGSCQIICPHWSSSRAYGDPTHKWPPVGEFAFLYWNKEWRLKNAPHCDSSNMKGGFNCNFDITFGYNVEPGTQTRSQEAQQFAIQYYKEVCQDIMATVTAIKTDVLSRHSDVSGDH